MINFKKALAGAAVFSAVVSLASAVDAPRALPIFDIPSPESYTSQSTMGRFGSDVDDFMGVNDWSGVEYEKFFGFVAYNATASSNGFNAGFAKNVKDNYLGLWFAGNGGDFTMHSIFADSDGINNSYEYNTEDDGSGTYYNYAASVLFGTKKGLGIKASMFYAPNNCVYSKPNTDKDAYTDREVFDLYADLQIGLGDERNTHFEIGVDSQIAKFTSNYGFEDNSWYDLYLRGGLTVKNWDLDLDTRWRLLPLERSEVDNLKQWQYGEANHMIRFTAGRGFKYEASENLAFKAKFKFPLEVGIYSTEAEATKQEGKYAADEDWHYTLTKSTQTDIVLTPTLALGTVWKAIPNKLNLNAGAAFTLGSVGWNIVSTGHRDKDDSATYDDIDSDIKFGWTSSTMDVAWESGFTAFFGKAVSVDVNYNLIGSCFTNMSSTNHGQAVGNQNFWVTVNDIFFTPTLNFLVTVKM